MATPKGNTRKTGLEQCYTPSGIATELTRYLIEDVGVSTKVPWLEPAAGTGSFVDAMHNAGVKRVVALDIEPKAKSVALGDFLATDLEMRGGVCLTNPPFGRNHSLSIPFFNHASLYCDTIGFIVPRSWRKWSVVNRLDLNFHKVADFDIDVSYVDEDGALLTDSRILNTIFQVWQRRDTERVKMPDPAPKKWVQSVKPDVADASLTIFGRGCGTLKRDFARVPNTTQMFIKASKRTLSALDKVDLSAFFNQVAYTEALSIVEINYALDHWFATGKQLRTDFLVKVNLEKPLV
jgi:predicted RNA methylase